MDSKIVDNSLNDSSSDDDIYLNAAAKLESLRAQSFTIEDDEPLSSPIKSGVNIVDQSPLITISNLETVKGNKSQDNSTVNSKIHNLLPSDVIELDDDDDDDYNYYNGPKTRSRAQRRIQNKISTIMPAVETPNSVLDLTVESIDTSIQPIDLSDEEPVELSVDVKIRWISRNIKRFELEKDENFSKVFKYFASLANVNENQIIITRNEVPISPLDTPSSLQLSIIDILEGGFVNECIQIQPVEDNTPKIKIKVQISSKKFWNFDFKKNEKFQKIFDFCAKENNVPVTKLKCFFDGESLMPTDTPDDLDIEDEACFDLKIIS